MNARTYPMRRLLAVYVVAASTSGCSLAPELTRPPLPVADTYPSDVPTRDGAQIAADLAWQDYFADPRLKATIAQALEHNRDLRVAALRVLDARALYQVRRADQWPAVEADAEGVRSHLPDEVDEQADSLYRVGARVASWEVDFWGRIRNLKGAALESFLATDAARRATTVSLVAEVADGYLVLRELDERIALMHKTIRTREDSFRIFTRRFEVGTTTRLDVAQVETLLTQALGLGAELERARAMRAHALTLLVGTTPAGIDERANLDDATLNHDLRVGLPAALLASRPDIVAAERRLASANANIGAARAAFFPNIRLTAFSGTASDELDNLFESGNDAWLFVPQLTLPLFDRGRRRANLDLAEVRRDAAVADYERTIQAAFRDVSDALSSERWLIEQVAIQRRALAAQSERARLAGLRYDRGSATFLEVLDAQRDLLSTEQELVQLRRALLSSRVALYAALGGGSGAFGTPPSSESRYHTQQVAR